MARPSITKIQNLGNEKLREFRETVCKTCRRPRCIPDMACEWEDNALLMRCKNYVKGGKDA